ncbi:endonuclease/exonuclease/phosphatase family protein [Nocardioides sp. SYSU DS0663]|uniref:endonuclease/exonuclease/phosphatase family protein n=1 Tax=Nocardioides sp. SYSU DS0663 TaxID=3416445 RepID=UPI003F4B630F
MPGPQTAPTARTATIAQIGRAGLVALLVGALLTTGALVVSVAGTAAGPLGESASAAERRKPSGFGFKLATYNILGSQHTRGRGGYGPGTHRARLAAAAIRQRGIDVIGLQEVQRDQLRVLRKRLDGYRIWPGKRLGNQGVRLQIAFRTQEFALVGHGSMQTRFHRQTRPIPWVKLRERRTDRRIYVVDIHNSPRGLERERDSATRKQLRLIDRLRRRGHPVFVTADANEKREFYCKVVGATDLRAANGGKPAADRCRPPQRRLRIDWVLGGRRVDFSHYQEDRGPRLRRASDHELVHARVRVRRRG